MLKYCKIINEEKGLVQVGTGSNINFYKSIGFTLQEVEEIDGVWYLQGKAPEPDIDKLKEQKRQELKEARDNYLKENNYYFSDNDKFNIINLIDYTEEQKNSYIEFIKSNLKPQYDKWSDLIKNSKNVKELEKIIIVFSKDNKTKENKKLQEASDDNTTK